MNQKWIKYLPAFIREKIDERHSLQKALGNTGWLMGDQLIRMGIGLIVGVWIARYLGPSFYGQLSYAIAFTMLFSPLGGLGMESIIIRKLVLNPSCRDEILGTAFSLSAASGLAVFVLATTGIHLIRPSDNLTLWLVGITAAGTIPQAFIVIVYWFESQVQSKFSVIAKGIAFLLASGGRITLILMQAPLIAFAWAGLAEVFIASVGLMIIYQLKGYRLISWRFSQTRAGKLLKDSWPLIFVSAMNMINLRIDQVMLGEMVGSAEVGVYSAAVRLTEPWSLFSFAICTSAFPAVMETWSTNKDLFYQQVQKLYNLMALIAYATAIPITFLGVWIVEILFGDDYSKAGPLLAALIWSGLFTNLAAARTLFLISMNWTKIFSLTLLMGCILNIVINYFLIPVYGAMGAVIATIASYWFTLHGACFFFKPLRRTGWMLTKAIFYPKVW